MKLELRAWFFELGPLFFELLLGACGSAASITEAAGFPACFKKVGGYAAEAQPQLELQIRTESQRLSATRAATPRAITPVET